MLCLLVLILLIPFGHSIHCLVTRPGYGLVSEECDSGAVACRIRIDHNSIDFYTYSPYDRNQFVCVLRGEYGDIKGSGCVKKRTGKIRCWCYAHNNCNSPENSKKLYEAFDSGDEKLFHETVEQIDFPDLKRENSLTTTKSPRKLGPKYSSDSESNHDAPKINNLPTDLHTTPKSQTKTHRKHHHTTTQRTTTESHHEYKIYKSPILKIPKEVKQSASISSIIEPTFSKPIVRPPPTSSTTEIPSTTTTQNSNIQVIYVNSNDKYQNVIGSPEFRKALHLDESDQARELPKDTDKSYQEIDPFNTEYNENQEDDDPLADLPMTEQEADLYLSDDSKTSHVRARSKDLDEYASASAYYDSTIVNGAAQIFSLSVLFVFAIGIFMI